MGVILGMTGLTIGSALASMILSSSGREKAAQIVEMTTVAMLVTTVATTITKAIKAIASLG